MENEKKQLKMADPDRIKVTLNNVKGEVVDIPDSVLALCLTLPNGEALLLPLDCFANELDYLVIRSSRNGLAVRPQSSNSILVQPGVR